ncbi:hypothetical protein LO772_16380 [Yinghuangia sp. ASG 101]|uniref:hypothetical protein n=1 Tax=Yinghuangia sp. ASG 101 TaxID=2896848 RepID=UPI001E5BCDB5|nr:hypothetical protein [Yinghuangia sp. ASG 101]UGQ15003.1 hypothetical protein LO772_16380 [Yinghuangia sp. ASG 101]
MFAQHSHDAVKAFSAWLLFTESAAGCGDDLTRKCAYDAAMKETSWTGGGLQAPVDLSDKDRRVTCFNAMQATPDGWKPADFQAGANGYRCDAAAYKYTGTYGKPTTLADIGKSKDGVKRSAYAALSRQAHAVRVVEPQLECRGGAFLSHDQSYPGRLPVQDVVGECAHPI